MFYVYAYIDLTREYNKEVNGYYFKNTPFYIGKGSGRRKYVHLSKALHTNTTTSHKLNKIRSLGKDNIKIVEVKSNLEEDEALSIETSFITSIGREDLKTGPLCNKCDSQGTGLSPEAKAAKAAKTTGEKNGMYNRSHTPEVRKLISEIKKKLVGSKHPHWGKTSPLKGKSYEDFMDEDKAKKLKEKKSIHFKEMRAKGIGGLDRHSEATKCKMSKSAHLAKRLKVTNIEDGSIQLYDSITELEKAINISRYKIIKIINEKLESHLKIEVIK